MRGWAFNGHCDIDSIGYYGTFGTSRSLNDPNASWSDVVLKVENYEDSIVGTFEGTFDSAGFFHAVWRPSENSSAAMVCTLGLLRKDYYIDYEERYFDAEFISFWNRFQNALRKKDGRQIARMVRFPIYAYYYVGSVSEETDGKMSRRYLLRHFDRIFNKEVTAGLLSFDALEISTYAYEKREYEYDLPVPEGTLVYRCWFNPYSEFSLCFQFARVNGMYKLIDITGAG